MKFLAIVNFVVLLYCGRTFGFSSSTIARPLCKNTETAPTSILSSPFFVTQYPNKNISLERNGFQSLSSSSSSSSRMLKRVCNEKASSALGVASSMDYKSPPGKNERLKAIKSLDIPLLIYFALWYIGNYFYKITNKRALKAAGGAAGFPMTISCLQLGIGSLYALFMWLAPDTRKHPSLTKKDIIHMLPLGFCYAATHSASVFAFGVGSLSFAEIVKAAEPVFAALLSTFVYQKKISKAKWLCLPIIIGGVVLASANELNFVLMALISACLANTFAAIRSNENKRLIESKGFKTRVGSVGNQFALTCILGFLMSIPFFLVLEGSRWGEFVDVFNTNPIVRMNLIASALWFYGYNELSTMTLKKTGAVTQSVANTAKRVIIIIGGALAFGESLAPLKLLGCAIGIGGVFLYSVADQLFHSSKKKA